MTEDLNQPGDPATMLELVRTEQLRLSRRLAAGVPAILLAWGVAGLVGFGLLWLIDGARPAIALPPLAAWIGFAVLMLAAMVVSGVVGARMSRGIRSTSDAAWTGTVFGLSWPVGILAIFGLGNALVFNGMPGDLGDIYYPTAVVLFVGVMYILAGGIWRAWQPIAMGGWIVLVGLVAPYFGSPAHYLVFAVAGGGVFLVGALVAWLWVRR